MQIFSNYEVQKLNIANVEWANIYILIIVLFLILLSFKQREKSDFLDRTTTGQIRGLAILMVVIGHIWVHVTSEKPKLIMSGDGVAFFLLLSGFGLALSFNKKKLKLREYITKRVNRVMIPYWFVTLLILSLDFVLLDRTYKISHIVLTFLGVNVYGVMHHFDYVRWYITFLLFWYIAAYFSAIFRNRGRGAVFILFLCVLAFPGDYYLLHFGWYQFLAFPVGYVLGLYIDILKKSIDRIGSYRSLIFIVIAICTVYYKLFLYQALSSVLPSIVIRFLLDLNSLIFAFSLIIFFDSIKKYYSRFLSVIGKYSYEIFLLHGVFLVKYNPVFKLGSLVLTFILFLMFIVSLSWLMNKSIERVKI